MKTDASDGMKAIGTILTIVVGLFLISVIVATLLIGVGNPFFPILLLIATALYLFGILWHRSKE
jgi:hypothetical protein